MASTTGTGSKRKKCVFATVIPRSLRVKTTPVESFTFSTTAKRAPGFSGPKKSRFAAADIGRQDEMLDLLFWLEGEGFPGHATLPTIARFLTWSEGDAERILRRLVARGDVVGGPAGDYRLTQTGRGEAGRRFAEEFSPLLAQGHGECNDPNCECRTKGPAECHGRQERES